ncbi:MAG: hypothetical protein WBH21_16565 [Vibrio anguillarum]
MNKQTEILIKKLEAYIIQIEGNLNAAIKLYGQKYTTKKIFIRNRKKLNDKINNAKKVINDLQQ